MSTRLNKYIALHTAHSRRAADNLVAQNRVQVNSESAKPGQMITDGDKVSIDGMKIAPNEELELTTIMINKPRGYVCSRDGQGSKTVYELLPKSFQHFNYVGRLDKDSSGLLLLTNDGELANNLTHPKYHKTKVYEIELNKTLQPLHQQMISDHGVMLEDGPSKFQIEKIDNFSKKLRITMQEGRNRQIRRTFETLGYKVINLHRTTFGTYTLNGLPVGQTKQLES